ncbi:hypothetical protein SS05631_c00980 [Sinorhizobium sp. CCBAU 05631]|nr:hypothetical protein SS05631_c00980 [Sinorhizobium sp. CCBAU 05631]
MAEQYALWCRTSIRQIRHLPGCFAIHITKVVKCTDQEE